ncbi:hypothetical protein HPC38_05055 [Pasteurellaceae bacterium HPA106]|uniref:hypothetical protein n=1 Tax=Spirabiliibacterium pneumoniae TaxID=221400 RepID=UPI001AACFF8F|nr:hypothetical protein [Spirabiliibacterium pneumoniae]MBE2896242.1 hypothetical protein [Spirabiliibacterium pneumoniae]
MTKTNNYYDSLPECSVIDYEIIPLPEAALLWCGVKYEDLAEEVRNITHVSQSIYKHPYIPCFEKKTKVLNAAVNNRELRAVREHGGGGEDGDLVAHKRRHFWLKDLKAFISKNYPTDRPTTIFHAEELKQGLTAQSYKKLNSELSDANLKVIQLQNELNEAKSAARDGELLAQQLRTHADQAISAKNDAEERLEKAREYYRISKAEIEKLKAEIETLKARNNTASTKTVNAQARFIKALLAVSFSEDVAENPRSNISEFDPKQGIKYSNGEIQKAFDVAGYRIPTTGRTLDAWIKDIDISDLKIEAV